MPLGSLSRLLDIPRLNLTPPTFGGFSNVSKSIEMRQSPDMGIVGLVNPRSIQGFPSLCVNPRSGESCQAMAVSVYPLMDYSYPGGWTHESVSTIMWHLERSGQHVGAWHPTKFTSWFYQLSTMYLWISRCSLWALVPSWVNWSKNNNHS